jgi:type IV pilus assembly protein PilE
MRRRTASPRPRGFTLIELLVVMTVAVLVTAGALRALQAKVTQQRRSDAHAALTKIETAQAAHRFGHGSYTADLGTLGDASAVRSTDGHYTLALADVSRHGYTAIATTTPTGAQHTDTGCPEITLTVQGDKTIYGPSPGCWSR